VGERCGEPRLLEPAHWIEHNLFALLQNFVSPFGTTAGAQKAREGRRVEPP
jgi:hypothetical protein